MIILFCYLSLIIFSLIDNARGPVYPEILRSFSLSAFEGSWYFTISSMTALLTTLFAHRWLKKIRTYDALAYAQVFSVVGTLLMGMANSYFNSVIPLYLGSLLFGFGVGGTTICMNLLVTQLAPLKFRRTLTSALHGIYALSSFCAPFIITLVLAKFSWDYYFIFIALLPMLLALSMWLLPIKNIPAIEPTSDLPEDTLPLKIKFSFGSFLALNVMAEVCLSSRIVFYLTEGIQWPQDRSNQALSYFFLALFFGRIIGAIIPKSFPVKVALFLAVLTSFIFSFLGIYYHPYFLSAVGFSIAIIFPFTIIWISDDFPKQRQNLITSVLNYVGVSLISMHFLFGSITNTFGISRAINLPWIAIVISLIAFYNCHKITQNRQVT